MWTKAGKVTLAVFLTLAVIDLTLQAVTIAFGFMFAGLAQTEFIKANETAHMNTALLGKKLDTMGFVGGGTPNFTGLESRMAEHVIKNSESVKSLVDQKCKPSTLLCPSLTCPQPIINLTCRENRTANLAVTNSMFQPGKCRMGGVFALEERSFRYLNGTNYRLSYRVPSGVFWDGETHLITVVRGGTSTDPLEIRTKTLLDRSDTHKVCISTLGQHRADNPGYCFGHSWSYSYATPDHETLFLLTVGGVFGRSEVKIFMNKTLIFEEASTRTEQRASENEMPCFGVYCYLLGTSGPAASATQHIYRVDRRTLEVTMTSITPNLPSEECAVGCKPNSGGRGCFLYCRDNTNNGFRTVIPYDFDRQVMGAPFKHCTDKPTDTPRFPAILSGCETHIAGNGGVKANIVYDEGSDRFYGLRTGSPTARAGANVVSYGVISTSEPVGDSINHGDIVRSDLSVVYQGFYTVPGDKCDKVCTISENVMITASDQVGDVVIMCSSNFASNSAVGATV